ncbi:MAG: hypothetical protein KJP06_01655 [Deltaproteobacteria bacterium]|nr:hypothetical protein [Deltaproteobacteria bacterium]
MDPLSLTQLCIVLAHAFIGWAICASIMGVGMAVTTLSTTLILHAIGGPLAFVILSVIYFKHFNFTDPLTTAIIFISFIIFMDIFIVALLIQKSFAMFKSILGTWLPFTLIFLATYLTGRLIQKG